MIGLLCNVNAKQQNNMYFGIFGGSNYLLNETDKAYIGSDPNCGEFTTGTAQGIHVGLKLGYILIPNLISLEGQLFYDTRPFNMNGRSSCFEVLDPVSNIYVPFERSHYFDGSLEYMSIDAGIRVQPISTLPISFKLTFDIGNPVVKNDYTVREAVYSPKSVSFSNGSPSRINESGEFNIVTSSIGLSGCVAYTMMFNEDLGINFEISYRYALNSALSDNLLKSNILRLNAGIDYYFGREKPKPIIVVPEEVSEPEILPSKEYVSKPAIVNDLMMEQFDVTETVVTQTFPLLPYYFFEEKSSELSAKYINKKDASEFDESNLNKETMTIYYNSLDIIGKRLSENESKIRIVGYSDGTELHTSQERRELAQARAKTIANYLNTKWNIPLHRLHIESGDKPRIFTNPEYHEAASENRRVEIVSDEGKNLAPVVHRQFSEYKFNTEKLKFNMVVSRPATLNYSITINQQPHYSNEVRLKVGKFEANLNLSKEQIDSLISISKVKRLMLKLDLYDGDTFEMHSIPIEFNIETEKFEIGRLNLIVFDFDKANLNKLNNELVTEFAKEAIKTNSEVNIIGTTDILGTQDYNQLLSQRRADNTANTIRTVLPDANFIQIRGKGSENPRYDNSVPEGRFYNRTVLIEVRTPIK